MSKNNKDDEGLFEVDHLALDQEWMKQSKIYHRYAVLVADLRWKWEHARSQIKVAYAEIALSVRSSPTRYDIEKVTEDAIKHVVITQHRYRKLEQEELEIKHSLDIAQATLDALEHKKKALENLVHLVAMDYYSTPRAPKQAKEKVEGMERMHTNRKIKEALNKDE